jgi:predicted patatin/cPLA2 family phospholipase
MMRRKSAWRNHGWFALVAGLSLAIGCMATPRKPVPPDVAVRMHEPGREINGEYGGIDPTTVHRVLDRISEDESTKKAGPHYDMLVLSSGGMYGAFTAGVLVGWSQAGTRPTFQCVTGVSIGALIATLAFLGPEYDDLLANMMGQLSADKVYRMRGAVSTLWTGSVASLEPLEQILTRVLTPDVFKSVAKAHADGRRLYVGTTSLETRRLVIWDMGAIASRGDPASQQLFRTILLASCSVPGFFPPVPIEIDIDGEHYTEWHVDGGASASLFFRFPVPNSGQNPTPDRRPLAGSNMYVIVAGKLYADPAPADPSFMSVAGNSLTSLVYAETRGDLCSLFMGSLASGVKFQMTALPQEFVSNRESTSFDPVEIKRLYEAGLQIGRTPQPWRSLPPGPEINEQTMPRSGVRFVTPEKDCAPVEATQN